MPTRKHPTSASSFSNPHDAFFKSMMSDVKNARQFFEIYLPQAIKPLCDFTTLRLQQANFVDYNLRQHLSDVLYSVKIEGQTGYIHCLIEHVSQATHKTAFQVLRYQIATMHQAIQQGAKKPPIVIPFVFYRGRKSPYPESCDPFDCFENPGLARKVLLAPHNLIDLSTTSDAEIATHKDIAMMEILQKHIHRDLLDLLPYFCDSNFTSYLSGDAWKSVVTYLSETGHSNHSEEFVNKYRIHSTHQFNDQNAMQTLREHFIQQGMDQGLRQGMNQGIQQGVTRTAQAMLKQGLDDALIKNITGLSAKELDQLK